MHRELVICVGNPGSGKSTTANRFASAGYTHVEQDATKTPAATMKAVKSAMYATQSVIVDATHSSVKNRAPYIALAKELAYHVRILWHGKDGRPWNALRPKPVPEIAYAVYSKYFEEPTEAEGSIEIVYP
jgi:bifunctional polynucleotide phosphatase/kinase